MPASRSSRTSRASKPSPRRGKATGASGASPGGWIAAAITWALALATGLLAAAWFTAQGFSYYYGDAEAHLNIARRILDTRVQTLEQIGTVWLPLPHLLMLPFAADLALWRTGWAGAIPNILCFSLAVLFLFLTVRRLTSSLAAAIASALVLAANPNLLYLQSTAMTEAVYAACALAALYSLVRATDDPSWLWPACAGLAALCGTITRYEGWFLLPFYALYLLLGSGKPRWGATALFCAIAALGPLVWLAHNWWWWGDPLEFYRGEWSARAIYDRALNAGMKPAPGDGDWPLAFTHFTAAVRHTAGIGLAIAGGLAMAACLRRRLLPALGLLLFAPFFYIWSLHGSGTPIFVPDLWPHSYYNTRYGLAALPLLAFTLGSLVSLAPGPRTRAGLSLTVAALALVPWLVYPRAENWICWKESQVNSVSRRAWTTQAARYLQAHYRGGGIAMSFGDATGALRLAGIPLREMLHEGAGPAWYATLARPELFLHTEWALTLSGDKLANALPRGGKRGLRYDPRHIIEVKGGPVVTIWQRSSRIRPPELTASEEEQLRQFEEALQEVP